jgi:hypothetical protein
MFISPGSKNSYFKNIKKPVYLSEYRNILHKCV